MFFSGNDDFFWNTNILHQYIQKVLALLSNVLALLSNVLALLSNVLALLSNVLALLSNVLALFKMYWHYYQMYWHYYSNVLALFIKCIRVNLGITRISVKPENSKIILHKPEPEPEPEMSKF